MKALTEKQLQVHMKDRNSQPPPLPPDYRNQKSRRQFCMVKLFVRFLIILGQKTVQSQLCYDKLLLP